MGQPANPLMQMLAPALMARLAAAQGGGGGAPGAPGGPAGPSAMPGGPPSQPSQDGAMQAGFGRELSSLRQADPMALAKTIQSLRQQVTAIISQAGMSIPGVSRAIAKCLQPLDAAIKEAQTAATTMQTVTPIQASAAQGAPGMSSPSLPMPGPSQGGQ